MTETPYEIRPAVLEDLDRLVELMLALQDHVEASNPHLWRLRPEARSRLKGQLAARLAAPSSCSLVVEHGDHGVVGMAFGRITTNKSYTPTRTGFIDQLFVRVDQRRLGLGSRLVAELCRFFAAEGAQDLSLRYVVGNDAADRFWCALGFSPRIVTTGAARQAVEARLRQMRQP